MDQRRVGKLLSLLCRKQHLPSKLVSVPCVTPHICFALIMYTQYPFCYRKHILLATQEVDHEREFIGRINTHCSSSPASYDPDDSGNHTLLSRFTCLLVLKKGRGTSLSSQQTPSDHKPLMFEVCMLKSA